MVNRGHSCGATWVSARARPRNVWQAWQALVIRSPDSGREDGLAVAASTGEPIAGMSATWTIAPTDHILSEPESGTSQQLFALPDGMFHGTVTITAQVDPLTATATFDVP